MLGTSLERNDYNGDNSTKLETQHENYLLQEVDWTKMGLCG